MHFLYDCSIKVTALLEYLDLTYLHIVGIHTISHWFWIGFFYTTRVHIYAEYSNQAPTLRLIILVVCVQQGQVIYFY